MTQVLTSNCPSPISPSCQFGKSMASMTQPGKKLSELDYFKVYQCICAYYAAKKAKWLTHVRKGKLWWALLIEQSKMICNFCIKTRWPQSLTSLSEEFGRALTWYCSLGSIMAGGGIWCPGLLRRRATRAGWYIRAGSKWLFVLSPLPQFVYQKGMHLSHIYIFPICTYITHEKVMMSSMSKSCRVQCYKGPW